MTHSQKESVKQVQQPMLRLCDSHVIPTESLITQALDLQARKSHPRSLLTQCAACRLTGRLLTHLTKRKLLRSPFTGGHRPPGPPSPRGERGGGGWLLLCLSPVHLKDRRHMSGKAVLMPIA